MKGRLAGPGLWLRPGTDATSGIPLLSHVQSANFVLSLLLTIRLLIYNFWLFLDFSDFSYFFSCDGFFVS